MMDIYGEEEFRIKTLIKKLKEEGINYIELEELNKLRKKHERFNRNNRKFQG